MSKWIRQVVGLLSVLPSLLACGCIDNDLSFTIMFAVAPRDKECTLEVQDEQAITFSSRGRLDLDFDWFNDRPYYMLSLQAHNYIVSNASDSTQQLNTMDILLERYVVRYEWIIGREALQDDQRLMRLEDLRHTGPISGVVGAAAEYDKPGKLLITLLAIPPDVGNTLRAMGEQNVDNVVLGLKVRLMGRTLGGVAVESGEFVYPVFFCWGCLPEAAVCEDGDYPACWPGQDSLVDCDAGNESSCGTISRVRPEQSGVHLTPGDDYQITWIPGDRTGTVDIYIDRNYPGGPETEIVGGTNNDGGYSWTVTGPASDSAAFIVRCSGDPTNSAASEELFSID